MREITEKTGEFFVFLSALPIKTDGAKMHRLFINSLFCRLDFFFPFTFQRTGAPRNRHSNR